MSDQVVITPQILKAALRSPDRFSRHILDRPLRPYQVEAARAITQSVLNHDGLTISVMMSRQAGKNELSAHIQTYLLVLHQRRPVNLVKAAPTFKPQIINSKMRLEQLLQNPLTFGRWHGEWSYIVRLGEARVIFFSADPSSSVVGATAHLALEFDEAQDITQEKHDKDFIPMGASTNCTRLYWGTAWDDSNLLEQMRQKHRELEKKDGRRRHYEYPWWVVAESNPTYGKYVEGERQRLGDSHPMFRTQYKLEAIGGLSRFLTPQQRAQAQGDHPRQHVPTDDSPIVIGVDIAGADEEEADAALRSLKPRKDSTTITIAALDFSLIADAIQEPRLRILDHIYWTGHGHREQYEALLDICRSVWHARRVVVDATGIGAGVADFLEAALGPTIVEKFVFTSTSKSAIGFGMLAAVNSGRFKMYAPDGSEECVEFWKQAELARYEMRGHQLINFYVPESEGHDDFICSAALAVHAATGFAVQPAAAVIPRPDDEVFHGGRF